MYRLIRLNSNVPVICSVYSLARAEYWRTYWSHYGIFCLVVRWQ